MSDERQRPAAGRLLADAVAARRRARLVSGLRGLAAAVAPALRGAGRRRRRRRAAGRRARATCAASTIPERPPPPAAPRRAADRVRVRGCWAMRSGEGDYRPTGNRTLWLPDLDVPDDLWASFQIPIGLAFFMELDRHRVRRRAVPEPGRRDRERAALRVLEPDARAQPGARRARARHRGADRQPAGRPADVRDRADRPLLRADRHDQGALGGDLRRRRRRGRRWPEFFEALRARGGRRRERGASSRSSIERSRPRGAGGARARVRGPRRARRCATPRRRCSRSTSRSPSRAAAPVYMIALTIQLMIEPARRALRRRHARAAGRAVRRAGALGGDDPQPRLVASSTCSCPRSPGRRRSTVPIACNYDLEVAAAKYLHSLPDGEAPLALHFNGMVYYPGDDGGLQMVLVPWTSSIDFRMPVSVWRETIEHYYPEHRLGRAALADARGAPAREGRRAAWRRSTPASPTLLEEARRCADAARAARRLAAVRGLRAVPVHAGRDQERDADAVRDRLPAGLRGELPEHVRPRSARVRCVEPAPATRCSAREVRFLAPSGERHQAQPQRRVELRRRSARRRSAEHGAVRAGGRLHAARRSSARRCEPARTRSRCCVENRTRCPAGSTAPARSRARCSRRTARARSRRALPARRSSARARASTRSRCSRPTADDAVLGAAIVLPDHPQIAPESRGGLFDSTEIEEALLLHVQALSDDERDEIERAGPGRARDGRARGRGDAGGHHRAARARHAARPGRRDRAATPSPPGLADPTRRRARPTVDGVAFRRGGKVVIRPGAGRRPARADARRPHRDDRADLHRLRRQDASRRDDRRRPRPGADARDRPVPVLLRPRGGGDRRR